MESQIALREVAIAAANFVPLNQISGNDFYFCTDTVSIALNANRLDEHGVFGITAIVPQEFRSAVQVVDHNIDIAIIIQIPKCDAAAYTSLQKGAAELKAYFCKGSVTVVLMNEVALAIAWDLRVDMAIGNKQINPTVIVVVEKLGTPTDIRETYSSDIGSVGNIGERIVTIVVEEGVVVVIEVSFEYVQLAIMIIVSHGNAHASLFTAILINGRTGVEPDLLECSISVIVVKETGC